MPQPVWFGAVSFGLVTSLNQEVISVGGSVVDEAGGEGDGGEGSPP